jgi:ATP-dependent Lhr-like helicase
MDIDGLERLLTSIERNEKNLFARDVIEASPLSQEILNARPYAYLDDAPLEERRTRAVFQRRWLDPETAADMGKLDQAAIDRVREEVWPEPRNADELHDALVELGFLTEAEGAGWQEYFAELNVDRRAAVLTTSTAKKLWVAAERLPQLQVVYPNAELQPAIAAPESVARVSWVFEEALVEIIRGRLEGLGPVTVDALVISSGLNKLEIETALLRLESEGFVIRGKFTPGITETEWSARRLLARIHSYTLNRLRQEIEPVASTDFIRFLLAWQKVAPDHQMEGPESLKAIIEQLEGVEAPAAAWEGELLPTRMVEYDPAWLDALCLSGEVVWARLSPLSRSSESTERTRGSGPVRNTPIALLRRKNFALWSSVFPQQATATGEFSTTTKMVYDYLATRGASFFTDIVENTKLLRSQVEEALAELVANGVVVSDSFAGLRALLTPGSRKTQAASRRKHRQPVYEMASAGRWSILHRNDNGDTINETLLTEGVAWALLKRYGVVFKRLLEREGMALPWRVLLRFYHRLEARGDIRGGRFVAGISGEQFALPEAIGMLRAIRRAGAQESLISVSAADPLNLAGIIVPGSRITAHTSNRILYQDGAPIAALESGETRFLVELSRAMEWKAKAALMRKATRPELRSYLQRPA